MIKLSKIVAISIFLLLIQCYLVKNQDINYQDYKLNNDVVPETYHISLDLSKNFGSVSDYNGEVKIDIKAIKETSKPIALHVKDIRIAKDTNIEIHETNTKNVIIIPEDRMVMNSTVEMLILSFADGEKLLPSREYQIIIKFVGKLHDDMYGLYRSEYRDSNSEVQWIATTQFQPTHARRAFPCFDEPAQKAKFNIAIKHASNYHALSNAQIIKATENEGIVETKFETTPKMSTYLIAIVVSKFAKISANNVDNINHALYSPKEVIGTGQYGFLITPKILNVMKTYTNVEYKASGLKKLDQIAIPDFSAGAMENWGLVTYRETALLWDPAESSSKNKERVATVIAHELAHMWFGNLITLEWWSYTWLNEGFARFFQYRATSDVETEWELDRQFVVEQQQSVFITDATKGVDSLTSDCFTPSQISSKFGTISYNKGASVIRMMEHFMGTEYFVKGIKAYFVGNHFGSTTPSLLWAAMKNNVNEDDTFLKDKFTDIMTSWTEQSGFPVVQVKKTSSDSNIILFTQKRFLYGENDTEARTWYIPITYTTSVETDFTKTTPEFWLRKNSSNIVLHRHPLAKWIVVNIQESGYYRVQYDDDLYKELETALKNNLHSISALNRAQIVDDALNLARSSDVSYAVALDVVGYLTEELEYYPWYSAFNGFAYLKRRIGSTSELALLLDQFIIQLMTKFYESVKFEEGFKTQIENHKRVLALTWACELHDEDCIKNSQKHFNMLKEQDVEIDPNIRSVVYCTTIRNAANRSSWDHLWNRFKTSLSAAEAVTILSALGCTKDEAILKEYLELSIDIDSEIRSQDALSVFTSVITGNSENVVVALEFLKENFEAIAENYGSLNALSSVITNLADRLTTLEQITSLEKFVDDNKEELKDAAEVADRAIKSAKNNLAWVKENEKVLLEYFKKEGINSASTKSTSLITGTVLLIMYYYVNYLIFV